MCKTERTGEIVKIDCENGDFLRRVGGVVVCYAGDVLYRKVGYVKKFTQMGRSKSLRIDRVNVKKMLEASS